jgi:hypothetical protein
MTKPDIIGDILENSPFKQDVRYAYDAKSNIFYFYVSGTQRNLIPVGMFSPISRDGIVYDPEHVVDSIAEQMSTFADTSNYEIELIDD